MSLCTKMPFVDIGVLGMEFRCHISRWMRSTSEGIEL